MVLVVKMALLHFRTPSIVTDDSSWKNAAECFTVALTLTLGGYESAIAPWKWSHNFLLLLCLTKNKLWFTE